MRMRVCVGGLCSLLLCVVLRVLFSDEAFETGNRKEHNLPTQTHMRTEGGLYNNISNNRRQQFSRPIILTPDDDHIGRNM
jgi:hypothetical protein